MSDIYRPVKGQRIPMPGNQPDWPQDGRPINHSNPYEARLLAEGALEKVPEEPQKSGTSEKAK